MEVKVTGLWDVFRKQQHTAQPVMNIMDVRVNTTPPVTPQITLSLEYSAFPANTAHSVTSVSGYRVIHSVLSVKEVKLEALLYGGISEKGQINMKKIHSGGQL